MASQASSKFENQEAFAEALRQQNLSMEDLKSRYRDQLTVQKLIDREIRYRVTVSPTEVTEAYQKHLQEFKVPAAVQAAVIVIRPKDAFDVARAQDLAHSLHDQLVKGEDFYDLARRYSDGPNAKMGGRLGFLEQGKSLKEIDQVLFTVKTGDISPVIRTAAGFHLFKVESIRPARQATLEEVQTRIQEKLFQQKLAARYEDWIKKLKAKSYIDIQPAW